MAEHGLKLVFVFDGAPPCAKAQEIARRRAVKKKYEEDRDAALARGDLAEAYSKATMTSRLTRDMVGEARELLRLMGIPTVQAPSEGEAQAAHMAAISSGSMGLGEQGLRFPAVWHSPIGPLPHDFGKGVPAELRHIPSNRAGNDRAASIARGMGHHA